MLPAPSGSDPSRGRIHALAPYETEVREAQRQAVRVACLLASPLLLVFSALDLAVVPGHWGTLLALRAACSALLLVVARLVRTGAAGPMPSLAGVLVLVLIPIECG